MRRFPWTLAALVAALPLLASPVHAESVTYQTPPSALAKLVDAPLTPLASVSPDHQWMLIMERPALPPVAELAEPELRIGGIRMKPRTNGPSRNWYMSALILRDMATGTERPVTGIPEGARLDDVSWSPDSKHIAFTATGQTDINLYVAEVATAKARRLLDARLNSALTSAFRWMPDSRTLIAATVPANRGEAPHADLVPKGPIVQENDGRKAPARTYQDLLTNPEDERNFEYYIATQLVKVTLDGKKSPLGSAGLVAGYSPSPNGMYLLVETLHRPFSYLVPYYRFPRKVEVVDLDGKLVKLLADLPLQEEIPVAFGSVATGPRDHAWHPNQPATLLWAEALDGGDAGAEAEERDRLFALDAPFSGEAKPWMTLKLRYWQTHWAENGMAFVHEYWWKSRQVRTWVLPEMFGTAQETPLWDRSWQDRYNDPGSFVTHPNAFGRDVVMLSEDGSSVFLTGDGASDEGDRPFIDRLNLATRESTRLWRSEAPFYEEPVTLLDARGAKALTRREAVDTQPNYFIRDLATGDLTQVSEFPHPHPELSGIQKELITYERADGVKLSGTLYLPPGYDKEKDGPLPVVLWAYPTEFKSADDAGQVEDSPYRFNRIGWWSPLAWLTQGYAVLDDPKLPIIGEGETEPNDTYVEQLVAGAQAAVDDLVRRGVGDKERMAVGGHSYGAFMVANLLTHCDLFKAGVARSGAYNRTLTPFGFRSEARNFWEAPEVYFQMSPFMHADKMNEPLLLIHGEADNNPGTFPMQTERYFQALQGLGGVARMVMLPHESHGYRGRESVMHVLWETNAWLDKYLKGGKSPASGSPSED